MDIACLAIAALKDLKIDCLQLFYLLREIRSSGPESFLCFVYILTLVRKVAQLRFCSAQYISVMFCLFYLCWTPGSKPNKLSNWSELCLV